MTNKEIKRKIRKALDTFIENDKEYLMDVGIYEPTISHRIAVYLEPLFPSWNIDCEYNKNLKGIKKRRNGSNIRPDIIIHKINTNDNSVIIEVKKCGSMSKLAEKDRKKLNDCIRGTLGYNLGVFIGVLKSRIDVCWIEGNNEKPKTSHEIL